MILWLFLLEAAEDLVGEGGMCSCRCFGAPQVLPDKNRNCQPLQGGSSRMRCLLSTGLSSRLCCAPQSCQDVVLGVPGVPALFQGKRNTPGLSSWAPGPARGTGAAPAPSAPRTSLPDFGREWWSRCCASRSLLGISPGKELILGRMNLCSPQGGAWTLGHSWTDSPGRTGLHPGAGGRAWSPWERGSPA